MLVEAFAGASMVVCTSCRWSKEQREDAGGRRGGAGLLQALEGALDRHPACGRVELQPMECLFACTSHCTVHLRAPGKMGYLLGRFTPDAAAAQALCDYAAAYLDSPDGVVRYADWPEGIKGRFIARLPPQGYLWRDVPPGA